MYQYKTLSNGIKVVAEKIDYLKSISIGVWVGNGSRYENKEVNGISHFIEHMLFKGTKNRSAAQIAHEIDSVGGQLDAFTSREYTCFTQKHLIRIFRLHLKFFRICFIIRVFHLMIWHLKDRL